MEDGDGHFRRGLCHYHSADTYHQPGDQPVAVADPQRCVQRHCRQLLDLGRDATADAHFTQLATLKLKENFTMNSKTSPDLILHNGLITTLDPKHPEATNFAVKDGRIVGVDDA